MSYQVAVVTHNQDFSYGLLSFRGEVILEDLSLAFSELVVCEGFHAEIDNIWDFTEAELDLDLREIQQIAEHFVERAAMRKGRPYVAFISRNPRDIELLKTYIPMAARYPVVFELFDRREEAIAWLHAHWQEKTN